MKKWIMSRLSVVNPAKSIQRIIHNIQRDAFLKRTACISRSVRLNLQFFAGEGEKTEKATPKRKQDARKKGQVLQSREISSSLILLIIFLSVKLLGSYMYGEIEAFFKLASKTVTYF